MMSLEDSDKKLDKKVLVGKGKEKKWISTELRVDGLKRGKRFSADQKLAILQEWGRSGNGMELDGKYHVHPQTT